MSACSVQADELSDVDVKLCKALVEDGQPPSVTTRQLRQICGHLATSDKGMRTTIDPGITTS